ncbi:hypothetical protein F5884DRAFT_752613 [Xylogone sp. PMI_703]|nr:hypothetical protein F5884DRAFT_752613 [Xylogone sp. PMI_703]
MRLRLTVKRNSLPDTPILWNIDTETTTPTISHLLEEVNEVIPLESSEWGLEDYVVELKGYGGVNYECLQFQPVAKVLRDEDEVIIRPLLNDDLKIRRLSGRHQISSDGKHLFDGVAFGRPLLRKPANRPAINIPPRQRLRLTSGEGDDTEENGLLDVSDFDRNRAVVLRTGFEGDKDEDEDEDFDPEQDDYLDSGDEEGVMPTDDEVFEDAQEDNSDDQYVSMSATPDTSPDKDSHSHSPEDKILADVQDRALRNRIFKLHTDFPDAPLELCKYLILRNDGDDKVAYEYMAAQYTPRESKLGIPAKIAGKKRKQREDSIESRSNNELEPKDNALSKLKDNQERSSSLASYQETPLKRARRASSDLSVRSSLTPRNQHVHFAPPKVPVDIDSYLSESSEPIASPSAENDESNDDDDDDDDSEFSLSRSDIDSEDSEVSGNSSELDEPISLDYQAEDTDTSDSESSVSDSSDSSDSTSSSDDAIPEEASSKLESTAVAVANNYSKPVIVDTDSVTVKPQLVAPRQGKKSTQKRNERRRIMKALNRLKKNGILPPDTTTAEFKQLELDNDSSKEDAMLALEALRTSKKDIESEPQQGTQEFEIKRQELLAALASGGIEVGHENPGGSSIPSTSPKQSGSGSAGDKPLISGELKPTTTALGMPIHADIEEQELISATKGSEEPVPGSAKSTQQDSSLDQSPSESISRRKKLDLGAGRRLLFGALGMKNPRTKKDEDELRNKLMKQIKPLKVVENEEKKAADSESEADEDPEAWREKIIYRAVECCHDGIELSEPPFPFVQRWDPQQQGNWRKGNRGGKRKKEFRDNSQYYEDDRQSSKKKKQNGKAPVSEHFDTSYTSAQPEQDLGDWSVGYDAEDEITNQLMSDIHDATASTDHPEDLPELPEDISSLSDLRPSDVEIGMVIAFKQLEMSEATKWQPEISHYRTALVINAVDDNLELTLAKRDRVTAEKQYDEDTGERIYGRFEAPDVEGDEIEGNDGSLNLTFNELIEPKIVQGPPQQELLMESQNGDNQNDQQSSYGKESQIVRETQAGEIAEVQNPRTSTQESTFANTGGVASEVNKENDTLVNVDLQAVQSISGSPSEPGALGRATRLEDGDGSALIASPRFNGFPSSPPMIRERSPEFPSNRDLNENGLKNSVSKSLGEIGSDDGSHGKDSLKISQYAKLPGTPSIASQVTDHGRQPDFDFDITVSHGDPLKDKGSGVNNLLDEDSDASEDNGDLPTPKASGKRIAQPSSKQDDIPESDSSMPPVEQIFFSQQYQKPKWRVSSAMERGGSPSNISRKKRNAGSLEDQENQDEDQRKAHSNNETSFVIPPGSQVLDLTLSSDIEPEYQPGESDDVDFSDTTPRRRKNPGRRGRPAKSSSQASLGRQASRSTRRLSAL